MSWPPKVTPEFAQARDRYIESWQRFGHASETMREHYRKEAIRDCAAMHARYVAMLGAKP